MVRSRIRTARAAAALVVVLALAADVGQAESLQDAWNAALTANQGLQAVQSGSAAAQRNLASIRAERVPTLTTVNAYTWLNNVPTFKSTLPITVRTRRKAISSQRRVRRMGVSRKSVHPVTSIRPWPSDYACGLPRPSSPRPNVAARNATPMPHRLSCHPSRWRRACRPFLAHSATCYRRRIPC